MRGDNQRSRGIRGGVSVELGQYDCVHRRRVLDDQIHRPQLRRNAIPRLVGVGGFAINREHQDTKRTPIAACSIDFCREPLVEDARWLDPSGRHGRCGDVDDHRYRPDDHLVTRREQPWLRDLLAVDPGTVAAPNIFDVEPCAPALEASVDSRHALGFAAQARRSGAADGELCSICQLDHARARVGAV
ncbi:MAG: hypothetical protein ABJE66_35950 [Deltaproteobacteria bacterium]